MKEFREFQDEVSEWADRNFPKSTPYQPLLGLAEEVGELGDAELEQNEYSAEESGAEEWKRVVGYDPYWTEHYEVSNLGSVRRIDGGRGTAAGQLLSPRIHRQGYVAVSLSKGTQGSGSQVYVHSLVTEAFIGPRPEGYEVNHIDGVKTNNRLSNLEYVTHVENMRHAVRAGLMGQKRNQDESFKKLVSGIGRLSHAHLKGEQGLRHTPLEIHRMKKDAVGDILIFLAHYCHKNNFDLQDCKDMVWEQVKQRDWIKNQKNGIVPPVEEFKPFGNTIADEMILDEVSGI